MHRVIDDLINFSGPFLGVKFLLPFSPK